MSASGQVAGHAVARRPLLITAAALALAGILTGCNPPAAGPIRMGDTRPASPAAATPGPTSPPAPAPAAIATVWPAATCDWAIAGLAEDERLDRAAAAGPPDPRFNQAPGGWAAYYSQLADQWAAIGQLVAGDCGRDAAPNPPSCATAIGWLTGAALAHDADLQRAGATAADASWNQAWAAFYRALSTDIGTSCP